MKCYVLSLFITLFSYNGFSAEANPCSDYLDLEKKHSCIHEGNYFIDYGYKYCHEFYRSSRDWNKTLKDWADKTLSCLITEIKKISDKKLGCEMIYDQAFGSHPPCYMESGFCSLKEEDRLKALDVIEEYDILSNFEQSIAQGLRVKSTCKWSVITAAKTLFYVLFISSRNSSEEERMAAFNIYEKTPEKPLQAERYISDVIKILGFENEIKKAPKLKQEYTSRFRILSDDKNSPIPRDSNVLGLLNLYGFCSENSDGQAYCEGQEIEPIQSERAQHEEQKPKFNALNSTRFQKAWAVLSLKVY